MKGHGNLQLVKDIFRSESERHNLKGVLGIASFENVRRSLMPIQGRKLEEISGDELSNLIEKGSVISVAYAYPEQAIEYIARKEGGYYDIDSWNIYAREYHRLNGALNATTGRLAEEFAGTAFPATMEGAASRIDHVEDYYGSVVSYRVAAELSGVGWRGKNELIVNPTFSCAIRLASVLTSIEIERTEPLNMNCSTCTACLDACTFLKFKDQLPDYREQCRRHINSLGLEGDVCGKCVKACYKEGLFREKFRL